MGFFMDSKLIVTFFAAVAFNGLFQVNALIELTHHAADEKLFRKRLCCLSRVNVLHTAVYILVGRTTVDSAFKHARI